MKEIILDDLKTAMKARDKELVTTIRLVKGAIQMDELDLKRELTDDEVITIIGKQIKTRKESIAEFEKGNRFDLVEKTQSEIKMLEKYMPEQLSEEEVIKIIEEVFLELNPTGGADMGKIMGALTPKLRGKADMGLVSKLVKEKLNS